MHHRRVSLAGRAGALEQCRQRLPAPGPADLHDAERAHRVGLDRQRVLAEGPGDRGLEPLALLLERQIDEIDDDRAAEIAQPNLPADLEGRFQIDVGQTEFFRGILEDLGADEGTASELRSALGRKDQSALEGQVALLRAPAAVTELLLALPGLYGRGDVLERAERLVKNPRSEAALANLAEVYRLLRAYGLADSVLLGSIRMT